MYTQRWHYALAFLMGLGVVGAALMGLAAALIYPNLPTLESLTDYRPKIPLRIYSTEGALLAEFGEERRAFMPIEQVPQLMQQAIIAAEDERFYEHGGVDTLGVLRAAGANLLSGGAAQGASTITMQVARNFFLTRERTLTRKFSEALLAIKIEHNLPKDKSLELYINQIYLGEGAYGFEAAARTYFGKGLKDLSIAEFAMLAGLPKGPSLYNPVIKAAAERLETLLNANGFATAAITGDLPQKQRMQVLSRFRDSRLSILVATDVASRGLHIEGVTHVINYDLPRYPEDYVQRIGRTARAGAHGKAISLACEEYVRSLPDVEDYIRQKIPVMPLTDAMVVTEYRRRPKSARKKVDRLQRISAGEIRRKDKSAQTGSASRSAKNVSQHRGSRRRTDSNPSRRPCSHRHAAYY